MSGEDAPENLSNGEKFVVVGGLKSFPLGYFIMLNTGELNFNKKVRGKKSEDNVGVIPKFLSKRDYVRKYSEISDHTGKIAPILGGGGGGMKLDIVYCTNMVWIGMTPCQAS